MRKMLLAIFAVLLMIGSVLVFTTNVSACHSMSASCSPTEKDITDINTWMVTYEIHVQLNPGCGDYYWVGFEVSNAPSKFHRKLYEKGDASKTNIATVGSSPPDANHNNWNADPGWIPDDNTGLGPGVQHYYAILEVWCDPYTENGKQATITVDVWSCDEVPNDLEHKTVTTITTVNIPNGIRMYHTVPFMATQWVEPGEWAEFDISIKDIGDAYGQIDLSQEPMCAFTWPSDWDWELPSSVYLPQVEPEGGTVEYTLKVKPPLTASDGDSEIFVVYGMNDQNSTYKHTVSAKTIVSVPKSDLSVVDDEGQGSIQLLGSDYSESESYNMSINIYNLGEISVNNFDVNFKLSTVGMEGLIKKMTVTDTLAPGEYIHLECPWTAIEGTHSLCIHVDEDEKIAEVDEYLNNEAGMQVEIGPKKPRNIILTMELAPTSTMPGGTFTVSGKANYNKEYDSLPVKDTNVVIKIKETGTIFNTKTNSIGEYTKDCTAPNDVDIYTVEVSITDENKISNSKKSYLTVAAFQVTTLVTPTTVITGDEFTVTGKVTDSGYDVTDAAVTIKLIDINDVVKVEETSKTNNMGLYTKSVTSPTVPKYSDFKIEVSASKDGIFGMVESKLYVDIDTDLDTIGNEEDNDDDGDVYPDEIEDTYGSDPLDPLSNPSPSADAGDDQTIDEGKSVSLDGGQSISPLTLTYTWDFGDGSDLGSGVKLDHKYTENGEYTVKLTVTDQYKGVDTDTLTITVEDLGPTADISGPTSGDTDTQLNFDASGSTTPLDIITKYEWDWDEDGIYDFLSTSPTAVNSWTDDGDHTVTVQVTDSDGSTSTASLKLNLNKKVVPTKGDNDNDVSSTADNTAIYLAVVAIIVIAVLLVLFMMMRKKKPAETPQKDERISNINAQSSRRPTTQFAEGQIKPALAPPGVIPQRQIGAPVQQRPPLPPSQIQPAPQESTQEQRDWNWNFNE